jgi:N-acyl-L-homoserine lactone synthetase
MADCHDSLGLVYFGLGDVRTAIFHQELSLKLHGESGNISAEADCYKALGMSYLLAEDTDRAVSAFQRL